MNTHLSYQMFHVQQEAESLKDFLIEKGIDCFVKDTTPRFDPSFANNESQKEFRVMVLPEDFDRANQAQLAYYQQFVEEIDADYYLLDFTDEELFTILEEPDKWSKYDFVASQKILADRGRTIDQEQIQKLKEQRLEQLAKPEDKQGFWVFVAYFCSFLGGFLGILIGYHFCWHKKSLPNGNQVFAYTNNIRKHGYYVFVIGWVFWIGSMIIGLLINSGVIEFN
jgi:Rps23 Pro-64 3,4-dihydroxylase Tpa1-like proline 4-hydroxylase